MPRLESEYFSVDISLAGKRKDAVRQFFFEVYLADLASISAHLADSANYLANVVGLRFAYKKFNGHLKKQIFLDFYG